jgi:hypothetical protein
MGFGKREIRSSGSRDSGALTEWFSGSAVAASQAFKKWRISAVQ